MAAIAAQRYNDAVAHANGTAPPPPAPSAAVGVRVPPPVPAAAAPIAPPTTAGAGGAASRVVRWGFCLCLRALLGVNGFAMGGWGGQLCEVRAVRPHPCLLMDVSPCPNRARRPPANGAAAAPAASEGDGFMQVAGKKGRRKA